MVSSVLSPEKIVGRQNKNRAVAKNFISGGSLLGASVVNGAANKIVGFQRAGVQPGPSVTGSIVSTISTNINNNVTSTVNKTLQGFSADYQKRLKQVDDAKPIGVLGKFLTVYKTALGFIQFFGNKKNIDRVRDNLEALKKIFSGSFEVAKLIRQVIIKIVNQLSNLPVASPSGGGGLNVDVDIPNKGLKNSAPKGRLGRMVRGIGGKVALGAGALGLGAVGAGVVNALSDSPQEKAQAAGTSPEIPGDMVDRFSSIIDKFANAVSKLFENKKQKPKQQSPGGGGDPGEGDPPPKPPGGGDVDDPNAGPGAGPGDVVRPGGGRPGSPGDVVRPGGGRPSSPGGGGRPGSIVLPQKGTPEEYRIAAALVSEGGSGVDATDILQVAANRIASGKYAKTYTDVFAQQGQFEGVFIRGLEKYKNIKTKEDAAKFVGVDTKEIDKRLAAIRDPKLRSQSADLVQGALEFRAAPQYYQREGLVKGMDANGRFYNSKWRGTAGSNQFLTGPKDPKISDPAQIQLSTSQPVKPPTKPAPAAKPQQQPAAKPQLAPKPSPKPQKQAAVKPQVPQVQVAAAPTATQAKKQIAQQVAQQPVAQKSMMMPINLGGGGQQQTGGGGMSGPLPSQGSKPSVPFLPTSNPDNFLVVYSRMVYNIVDG